MDKTQWDEYLLRFREPSDRHWAAEETPIGHENGKPNLSYLDPCAHVLDIGCGYGHAMRRLLKLGKTVCGIDISPVNVEKCREADLKAYPGDMHSIPFGDRIFDGILMWDIFEHALAPVVVLWECARVLKDDGRLVVYTPPTNWADHPVHVIIPTQEQMKYLVKMGGFDIEQSRELQHAKGMLYHMRRNPSLDRGQKKKP